MSIRATENYNLAGSNPELVPQWHDSLNGTLSPYDVTPRSTRKVWWRCDKGHEWETGIINRVKGHNCPYCAGQRPIVGETDLATTHSDLVAAEWHPTKNGDLTPQMVMANSHKKVWWRCDKGHDWKAIVSSRTRGSGCPTCAKGRRSSFPERAIHFYVNRELPDTLGNVKSDVFPWLGSRELDIYVPSLKVAIEYDGLFWHQSIEKDLEKDCLCFQNGISLLRVREPGLPLLESTSVCFPLSDFSERELIRAIKLVFQALGKSGDIDLNADRAAIYEALAIALGERSLLAQRPDLAAQWHPTKNGSLTPADIMRCSGKKVWWVCSEGHEWQAPLNNRIAGNGCPYCAGQMVLFGETDLHTTHPDLAAEWHPTKNGELTPEMVTAGSSKKVWWQCVKGHEWYTSISGRSKGHRCPYCSGRFAITGENDLATLSPQLAAEWHPSKNGDLTPSHVTLKSNKKVWWQCEKGHEWQAKICRRADGSGCPYCSGRFAIKGETDLATTNPDLAAQWHPTKNGELDPSDVKSGSNKKVWWLCPDCSHEWQAAVCDRLRFGCPLCGRKKVWETRRKNSNQKGGD